MCVHYVNVPVYKMSVWSLWEFAFQMPTCTIFALEVASYINTGEGTGGTVPPSASESDSGPYSSPQQDHILGDISKYYKITPKIYYVCHFLNTLVSAVIR